MEIAVLLELRLPPVDLFIGELVEGLLLLRGDGVGDRLYELDLQKNRTAHD